MDPEKYTLTYERKGTTIVREFEAEDLHELAYNILQFTRSAGFDYVDMLEFSTPNGYIYRAEVLDD
jgi:hypothetical protein